MRFVESCVTGILPDGSRSELPKMSLDWINKVFIAGAPPARIAPVTDTSPVFTFWYQRVYEAFGSSTNLKPFFLAESQMNTIKGQFMGLAVPISSQLGVYLNKAVGGTEIQEAAFFSWIQKVGHPLIFCKFHFC
jgi:hypothetical protein